jgi:hypothetical protein
MTTAIGFPRELFPVALLPNADYGLLINEVSR